MRDNSLKCVFFFIFNKNNVQNLKYITSNQHNNQFIDFFESQLKRIKNVQNFDLRNKLRAYYICSYNNNNNNKDKLQQA